MSIMPMLTPEQLTTLWQRRAATRAYDPAKKISDSDFEAILQAGRLSPSSVGSEPWQFLVVQNRELRAQLKPVSWGMATQVDDASHLVVILAKKNARYDSPFFDAHFQIHDADILASERSVFDWACKQTYIAMANMMTAAAALGIDSCPIEGFDYAEVNRILSGAGCFDAQEWGVSVMLTFGYRAADIKPKSRKPMEEVVRWIR